MHFRKPIRLGRITAAAMLCALTSTAAGTAAHAADLGGNCCADLEERVAELEATAARKGNRKVSLTVSGLVHEAVLFYDVKGYPKPVAPGADNAKQRETAANATESNIYVGTHNSARSRFRFRGNAQINADWSAGFFMEIGVRANALNSLSQSTPRKGAGLDIRHEALYVKSKTLGTLWIGHTGSAIEGITEVCVGCSIGNATPDQSVYANSLVSGNGSKFTDHGAIAGTFPGEGDRRDIIKWISPTIAGFSASVGVGGDDYWDAALRYAGEFGAIRIAAGVGYGKDTDGSLNSDGKFNSGTGAGVCDSGDDESTKNGDRSCQIFGGSASLMHIPTGLYIRGSYGQNKNDLVEDRLVDGRKDDKDTDSGWEVTAGINTKLNSLGNTNFWALYNEMEREIDLESKLTTYGIGVNQKIDAAAMDMYIWYRRYEAKVKFDKGLGTKTTGEADVITAGARIQF